MRSKILAILVLALAGGCVDEESPTGDEVAPETEPALATSTGCIGVLTPAAPMPPVSTWTGTLPPTVSATQVWAVTPIDSQGAWIAGFQVDWQNKKVTWVTLVSSSQRAALTAAMSKAYGRMGGVIPPPPPPPPTGTDWNKFAVNYAARVYLAYDKALSYDACLGAGPVNAPMPAWSQWTGTLPPNGSTKQVWLYHPINAQATLYAGYQVEPSFGKVLWRTQVTSAQLPALTAKFASASYGRLGGVQPPPPPPPPVGTDDVKFRVMYAQGLTDAFDQAIAIANGALK